MSDPWNRLRSLRVADVMHTDVVVLHEHQSMAEAARVFLEHGITGAPVVDDKGHVTGILSATDFVRREARCCRPASTQLSPVEYEVVHDEPCGPVHIQEAGEDRVSTHMSRGVQTVAADDSLLQAARAMCAEHIHRLVVLDARGAPLGVLTSLDLVAVLMQAAEEAAQEENPAD